jgi:Mg-chelatase subunit ChlD
MKETLEEAAERLNPYVLNGRTPFKEGLYQGAKWQQQFNDTSEVTRVEVIQHSEPYNGRAYTNYDAKEVEIQFQDRGKTLKIFLK